MKEEQLLAQEILKELRIILQDLGLGKQQILKEIREWFIEYCINDK